MRRDLMDILACPVCKGRLDLTATQEAAGEVETGTLRCEGCAHDYPIAGGIPHLLPPEPVPTTDTAPPTESQP